MFVCIKMVQFSKYEDAYLINFYCVYQEAGRRAFWTVNGPHILKIGYEDEQDPKVMEAYERVGSLVLSLHSLRLSNINSFPCT